MDEKNDVLIASILYILLALAAIPLVALIVWLLCKLYKNQMDRIKYRSQIRRMEEGAAIATDGASPDGIPTTPTAPTTRKGKEVDLGNGEDTIDPPAPAAIAEKSIHANARFYMGAGEFYKIATSDEMERWKYERDSFVKRSGQGDLAEVLRSQSRTGREEEEEEEEGPTQPQQVYTRDYSPPPRIPTL
ncbi:hypothetical protein TWF481_001432 [Arthrobotrys musiformis]|uniref:Uncharacterized protein n=1 Tax=Arthrobotrys musiformis TaxID=47236 RepID=A0AAV9WSN2_9PEZI